MNDFLLEELQSLKEQDLNEEATFSVREAADILDMKPSSVSHAIDVEKIKRRDTGGRWKRIPASEVIKYGARWRGMETKELREKIQKKADASDNDVIKWIILGLGIAWLINEISS